MKDYHSKQAQAWASTLERKDVHYIHSSADEGYIHNFGEIIAPLYKRVVKNRIFELLSIKEGNVVLDAGCGVGYLGQIATGFGLNSSSWEAIDQVEEFVRLAKKSYPSATVGTLTNLPFPDASFDYVISTEVIEHIQDYDRAISEIIRVLKPGGKTVITTPNGYSISERMKHLLKVILALFKTPSSPKNEFYDVTLFPFQIKRSFQRNGANVDILEYAFFSLPTALLKRLPRWVHRTIVAGNKFNWSRIPILNHLFGMRVIFKCTKN